MNLFRFVVTCLALLIFALPAFAVEQPNCGATAADAVKAARDALANKDGESELAALSCLIEATARLETIAPVHPQSAHATSIDWSASHTAYTPASCGAFTFTNMRDGAAYNLFVEGTGGGTCSFKHPGLTFKMPPGHGPAVAGSMTVYSFVRAGSYVFVTWVPGY